MSIPEVRRHTGVVASTGSRIILVFRKIPDDPENCLVVMADALPDQIAQNLESIVHSREAQSEVDLYVVLNRHQFSDGSNVLNSLHQRQLLSKMPVSAIEMTPLPGRTVPLSIINEDIDAGATVTEETTQNNVEEVPVTSTVTDPSAPVAEVEVADTPQIEVTDPLAFAKELMTKSNEMKELAEELKHQAISLDPSLKPSKGRPKDTDSEQAKKDKRNAKRREAYAKKKAAKEAKEAAKEG